MKQGVHPEYKTATVKCACGNEFETRSTKSELRVDICSKCHPFFTGKQKLVDTGGRVGRFNRKFNLDAKKKTKSRAGVCPFFFWGGLVGGN